MDLKESRANTRRQVNVTSLLLGFFALFAFLISLVVATTVWLGSEQVVGTVAQVHSERSSRDAIKRLRSIDVLFELDNEIVTQTIIPRKLSQTYKPGDEIELLVTNNRVYIKSVEEQFGLSIFLLATLLLMVVTWAGTRIRR